MQCIVCGKEAGDFQLCGECAARAFEENPLWHCRDFLIGDSVPDVISRNSLLVLSLAHDRESFIDAPSLKEDIKIPKNPEKSDAKTLFWKINMYMAHMDVPLYLEGAERMEPTVQDIDNLSHLMKAAESLSDFISSADEDTLCRLASLYYFSRMRLRYLRGISPKDRNEIAYALDEKVRNYLSEGERIMPHRGHIFVNQAYLARKSGDFQGALDLYRMVPEYDSNPRAMTGIGRAYEGLEMTESADEAYTAALRLNDKWVDAWEGKASVALATRRWGAALQFISRAITLRPDFAHLRILKGNIFAVQGIVDEADKEYRKAIKLKHGEEAWLKRAELMYNNGKMGAALQSIERYLFYFPDDEEGLWWRERIKEAVDGKKSTW